MSKIVKRRRRSPATARDEILDAAENILLEQGPADLKFHEIATTAKIAKSTAHHHFGSLEEIRKALVFRVLQRLTEELSAALAQDGKSGEQTIEQAIAAVYSILSAQRYAKVLAWVILSTETSKLAYLGEPLEDIRMLVTNKLSEYMLPAAAQQLALHIIYQISTTAIGEGLIGNILQPVLGKTDEPLDGLKLVSDLIMRKIFVNGNDK